MGGVSDEVQPVRDIQPSQRNEWCYGHHHQYLACTREIGIWPPNPLKRP